MKNNLHIYIYIYIYKTYNNVPSSQSSQYIYIVRIVRRAH